MVPSQTLMCVWITERPAKMKILNPWFCYQDSELAFFKALEWFGGCWSAAHAWTSKVPSEYRWRKEVTGINLVQGNHSMLLVCTVSDRLEKSTSLTLTPLSFVPQSAIFPSSSNISNVYISFWNLEKLSGTHQRKEKKISSEKVMRSIFANILEFCW